MATDTAYLLHGHLDGSPVKIDIYLDSISSYSYMALSILKRYRPIWGIHLNIYPVSLPSVMQSSGNKPPGFIPNKAKYMKLDLYRAAKVNQVPYKGPPKNHPSIPNPEGHALIKSGQFNRLVVAVGQLFGCFSKEVLDLQLAVFHTVFNTYANRPLHITEDMVEQLLGEAGMA